MKILSTVSELRNELIQYRHTGKIALVPTMGYLHDGHVSLVKKAVSENNVTVVSIFINPMQFGPSEDLDKYPRDLKRDEELLCAENVDYVFYPSVEEMYPAGFTSKVSVSGLTSGLCGASRPGHFDGVTTVVLKLFNIIMPDNAYFGLKDYQQFTVINRMVKDLNINIQLTGCPIIRENDGLALSSRNVYLSTDERRSALSLSQSFNKLQQILDSGEKSVEKAKSEIKSFISSFPYTKVDYVEFVHPDTLVSITALDVPFMCMLAVNVGKTRLIDNKKFNL